MDTRAPNVQQPVGKSNTVNSNTFISYLILQANLLKAYSEDQRSTLVYLQLFTKVLSPPIWKLKETDLATENN